MKILDDHSKVIMMMILKRVLVVILTTMRALYLDLRLVSQEQQEALHYPCKNTKAAGDEEASFSGQLSRTTV